MGQYASTVDNISLIITEINNWTCKIYLISLSELPMINGHVIMYKSLILNFKQNKS